MEGIDYGHYEFLFGFDAKDKLWSPILKALNKNTELDPESVSTPGPVAAPEPAAGPTSGPAPGPVRTHLSVEVTSSIH